MKKSFGKILGLTLTTFVILFFNSAFADEAKTAHKAKKAVQKTKSFYVKSREPYLGEDEKELCRQVSRILNEPENEKFSKSIFFPDGEFVIPAKYSDFSLPKWEDVPHEDLTKYVKSKEWLAKVKKYEDEHQDEADKLRIQKTNLDLDRDGEDEVMLRFRFLSVRGVLYYWSSFVSDVNPSVASEGYNKSFGKGTYWFKYKGKIYEADSIFYGDMTISEPTRIFKNQLVVSSVCHIELTPIAEKPVRKLYEKYEADLLLKKQKSSPTSSTKN